MLVVFVLEEKAEDDDEYEEFSSAIAPPAAMRTWLETAGRKGFA
jgi:hypothetical protein